MALPSRSISTRLDLTTWLIIGVITGAVGTGYFVYGKTQQRPIPLIAGIALCVYPYFISQLWLAIVIGVVLIVVPLVVRV